MSADRTPTQPPEDQAALRQRPIRSFVLRQGRTTEAQKRAFELHWPKYGVDYAGTKRDFEQDFQRRADLVLEIGFGNGEQVAYAAANEPERDFLAIEVHGPGVGRLLNALAAGRLDKLADEALCDLREGRTTDL